MKSFRFSTRAQSRFDDWKTSGLPEELAQVLSEIREGLWHRLDRQFRDLQWSNAQTYSDALQELQRKALAGGWAPVEFDRLDNLAAKALVVVRNHMLDRARRRRPMSSLDEALEAYTTVGNRISDDLESRETSAIVHAAIDSLDPDRRDALRMKYLDGYTNDAIARVLGKPSEDAVRMLLGRARKALGQLLLSEGENV